MHQRSSELRRVSAERRDTEAGQARLVYAVTKHATNGHVPVVVVNDSPSLIFVERLEVHATSGGAPVVIAAEPGDPGGDISTTWTVPPGSIRNVSVVADVETSGDRVKVCFIDAAGLRWHKLGHGQPERVL